MEYIVHKRFKNLSMSGQINLPYNTKCEESNGVIYYDNKPICYTTSQNAYDYFARNNDKNGQKRGKLTKEIVATLANRDENYQERWNKLWDNEYVQKFRRKEHGDFWVWNYDFYNASIDDLQTIKKIIEL